MSCSDDDKKNNLFCPLAWSHSFVNQNGAYQVCCTSEEYDNNIRDENGKVMMIDQGVSQEAVMNSKYMKDLRLKLLAGEWPKICGRCKVTEDLGGASRRNVENMHYEGRIDDLISSTKSDGTIPLKVTSADYRLGNICNLQCRMCNPRSTKLWINDWNLLKDNREAFSQEQLDSYKKYDWVDSPQLLAEFEAKAADLEHIHFAGGEPLLVPQMSRLLQKCVDSGNAKNITLTYNTNLTILPEKVLQLWKNFKAIKILASVDAVGSLNDYIRHPSVWEKIDQNLRFIDENHETYKITECMISTTVQALNVLELPKLYQYLDQFKFIVKAPNLVNLHVPFYMQTTVLPLGLKMLAESGIKSAQKTVRSKLPSHYQYLADNVDSVINFMLSQNGYALGNFQQMIRFQRSFDELKNLSLAEHCPEIHAVSNSMK